MNSVEGRARSARVVVPGPVRAYQQSADLCWTAEQQDRRAARVEGREKVLNVVGTSPGRSAAIASSLHWSMQYRGHLSE